MMFFSSLNCSDRIAACINRHYSAGDELHYRRPHSNINMSRDLKCGGRAQESRNDDPTQSDHDHGDVYRLPFRPGRQYDSYRLQYDNPKMNNQRHSPSRDNNL
jgi:hypothetical protein